MQKKPWYQSKAILSALAIAIIGVLKAFGVPIPNEIYAILGGLGLLGLRTAKTKV